MIGCKKELSVSSELVSDGIILTVVPGEGGVDLFYVWIYKVLHHLGLGLVAHHYLELCDLIN